MRPEKQLLLDEIKNKIDASKGMVLVQYDKLPPVNSWEFSTLLEKKASYFEVVKKRIFIKASEKAGLEFQLDQGKIKHLGVVFFGEDSLGPIKALFEFSKNNENLAFDDVFAQIEDRFYNAAEVASLSKLPSQNEMRAQFLGLLEAPMVQTVSVIENLLCSVMYCLENKNQQNE